MKKTHLRMKSGLEAMLVALLFTLALSMTGCKARQLGPTELGIKVVKLPAFCGGGVKDEIIPPGSFKVYAFWTSIYPIDTQIQSYTWSGVGQGDDQKKDERINTRAADGNEVHLQITVQYHRDPTMIKTVLTDLGQSDQASEDAIQCWSRSHIRTYLGMLETDEYYNNIRRYEQCDITKAALNRDLNKFGIVVDRVIFDQHSFATEYQNLIDEARQTEQQAQGKANEVKTKEADWLKQLQTANGTYNQRVADANGRKRQKIATTDAYYTSKKNEAEAIRVAGANEVAGIQKQIQALQQAGGENVVRLEYGLALLRSPAHFFVLPGGSGSENLNFNTTNYNQLLRDMGLASLAPPTDQQPTTAAPTNK